MKRVGELFRAFVKESPRANLCFLILGILAIFNFRPEIYTGTFQLVFMAQAPKWVAANLTQLLPYAVNYIFLDLILILSVAILVNVIYGEPVGQLWPIPEMPIGKYFLIIIAEEVFARYIFVGLIPKLWQPLLWPSMIVGNAIWAWVHLNNYSNPRDKILPRVFPHFVGGLLLAWVYLKFGLVASITFHLFHNSIAFLDDISNQEAQLSYWQQEKRLKNFLLFSYYFLLMLASILILSNHFQLSLMDIWEAIRVILANPVNKVFLMPFGQIVLLIAVVTGFFQALMALIGTDLPRGQDINSTINRSNIFVIIIKSVIDVLKISVLCIIANLFFVDMAAKTIMIMVFLVASERIVTGSANARVWLANFLPIQMLVGSIMGLKIWTAMGLFFCWEVINLLPQIIISSERQELDEIVDDIKAAIREIAVNNVIWLGEIWQELRPGTRRFKR